MTHKDWLLSLDPATPDYAKAYAAIYMRRAIVAVSIIFVLIGLVEWLT